MKEYFEITVNLISGTKLTTEMANWCVKFIGRYGRFHNGDIENWSFRYGPYHGDRVYIFAREDDAVLFALRWK